MSKLNFPFAIVGVCLPLALMSNLLAAADGQPAASRITRELALCVHGGRLTAVNLAVDGSALAVQPVCVDDRTGSAATSGPVRVRLPTPATAPASIYSTEAMATFQYAFWTDGGTQVADIRYKDGRACIVVRASPQGKPVLPAPFLSASGDWRQALDYMIDDACSTLVVRAGNRVVVASVRRGIGFDLYGLRFFVP